MRNIADHIHADGAQARKGNIGRHIAKLRSQNVLNGLLDFAHSPATHQHRTDFRQRKAAFAVHGTVKPLCDPTPQIDGQSISRTYHVIGPDREVHGKRAGIQCAIAENVQAKAFKHWLAGGGLYVQIVKRRDVRVGICFRK